MNIKILKFPVIDSTHKHAIRLIEEHNEKHCLIIADKQTDGIGRCGRSWSSNLGNLFLSLIRDRSNFPDVGQVSMCVACAVHDTIANFLSEKHELRLHWPNDVYYKSKKISGILLSIVNDRLVISIGINVNSSPEQYRAISIKDTVKNCTYNLDVKNVLDLLLIKINEWLYLLEDSGFNIVKKYWLRNVNEIDCNVTIKNGCDVISGIFIGLDETGRLILRRNGKDVYISSGDMFVNEKCIMVNYE